jgi:hypothetical protein
MAPKTGEHLAHEQCPYHALLDAQGLPQAGALAGGRLAGIGGLHISFGVL